MIYALAASSLNLVLGYGGMLSFGHAAFVGAGAYTAGILLDGGHRERLDRLAGRGGGRRGARGRDRRDLASHARRVLHHDHARVRADDVLRRRRHEDLRRRGRPAARLARDGGAGARPQGRHHLLLPGARDPRGRAVLPASPRPCALRARRRSDPRERDADGGDRLPHLPLQARCASRSAARPQASPARCWRATTRTSIRTSSTGPSPAR